MADKFLNTGGSGGVNISNGTTDIFAATLSAANLDPSRPIKTNAVRELVSSNLDIADINNLQSELDNVISNPFPGTLKVGDLETDNYFSVNDELQKIDNLTASTEAPDTTNITGLVNADEIATGRIYDEAQQTFIELDGTTVAVSANDLTLNGNSVLIGSATEITDLETKTQNIELTTVPGQTDITGTLVVDEVNTPSITGTNLTENITGTKTSVVSGANTYSAASHEVIGDYVSDINIKDQGLFVYNSTLTGTKTREACIHTICNEVDVPLKIESRTGSGIPVSAEIIPYADGGYGTIRMKGISSNTKCDILKWDVITGGGARNLGQLRFSVLDEVENVDDVLLLQASLLTTEPSATINSVLNIKNSTTANTMTISSLPAGTNAIQSSTNLDETITGNKTIVATNITENIGANKVENIASNKVVNITANHLLNSNTSVETHIVSKTITAPDMTIESDFLVVDASINTTDFAKYQGAVDYLNPPGLNSLAAVGYVNQEITNIDYSTVVSNTSFNEDMTALKSIGTLSPNVVYNQGVAIEIPVEGGGVDYPAYNISNGGVLELTFSFPSGFSGLVQGIELGDSSSLANNSYIIRYRPDQVTNQLTVLANINGSSTLPFQATTPAGITAWRITYTTSNLQIEGKVGAGAYVSYINGAITPAVLDAGVAISSSGAGPDRAMNISSVIFSGSDNLATKGDATASFDKLSTYTKRYDIDNAPFVILQDNKPITYSGVGAYTFEIAKDQLGFNAPLRGNAPVEVNVSTDYYNRKWDAKSGDTNQILSLEDTKIGFNQNTGFVRYWGYPIFEATSTASFKFKTTGTAAAGDLYVGITDNPTNFDGLVGFSGQSVPGFIYNNGVVVAGSTSAWDTGDECEFRIIAGTWEIYKNGLPTFGGSFSITNNGKPYYFCIINNQGGGNLVEMEITEVITNYVATPTKQISVEGSIEFNNNPVYVDSGNNLNYTDTSTNTTYPIVGPDVPTIELIYSLQGILNEYDVVTSIQTVPLSSVIDGSASTNYTAGTDFREHNPSIRNGTNILTINEDSWYSIRFAYSHPNLPILGANTQEGLGKDCKVYIVFNGGNIIPFGTEDNAGGVSESVIGVLDKYLTNGTTFNFSWEFGAAQANEDFFINLSIIKMKV